MIATTDELRPGDVIDYFAGLETVISVRSLGDVMRTLTVERQRDGAVRSHTVAREATHKIAARETVSPTTTDADNAESQNIIRRSRRIIRRVDPRPSAWVDVRTGHGVHGDGTTFSLPAPVQLDSILGLNGARIVHLVGPRPGDDLAGFRAWRTAPAGWADDGSYLEVPMLPALRYRSTDGRRIDVQRAATWLGETDCTVTQCAAAWSLTDRVLRRLWHHPSRPVTILATPATTGRELAARLFTDDGYPVQADDVQDLIRSTSGQGRVEVFDCAAETIRGLVELDGRRMYTALVDRLPTGVARLVKGDRFVPFRPGRFLAEWAVPDHWEHIGLLPALSADGWRWPARPGERARGWIDAWELQLARTQGWTVDISESLVWPVEQPKRGPLDEWGARLRDAVTALSEPRYATEPADVRELTSTMLRAIVLHAIGAYAGRSHAVTSSAPIWQTDAVPADARNIRIDGPDLLMWATSTGQAWSNMAHPEWSSAIWARARVRLLDSPAVNGVKTGALHVPRSHLLAVRTDAIYLTRDPRWPDDGKPGRFRLKATANPTGPLPTPRTMAELLALRNTQHRATEPTADRAAALENIRTIKKGRAA